MRYSMEAGGKRYEYIPCLNATPDHIQFLAALVEEQLGGWLGRENDPVATRNRALAMGADK